MAAYARGLNMVIQNQLFPTSGNVIVRTRATLARLMHVQKVSKAAWPRLGTIIPSNLRGNWKYVNTMPQTRMEEMVNTVKDQGTKCCATIHAVIFIYWSMIFNKV